MGDVIKNVRFGTHKNPERETWRYRFRRTRGTAGKRAPLLKLHEDKSAEARRNTWGRPARISY